MDVSDRKRNDMHAVSTRPVSIYLTLHHHDRLSTTTDLTKTKLPNGIMNSDMIVVYMVSLHIGHLRQDRILIRLSVSLYK